jgi:hypothetical protein
VFDDLASLFYHNVVSAHDHYATIRDENTSGRNRHTRAALEAATALYHFREHLPPQYAKTGLVAIAVQTAVVDVMASGEFCNMRRRVAHLLTMYGFVIYVVTTVIMVFVYPTPAAPTPANLPTLWYIGGP